MTDGKLRVALVGCGQIADAHLGEIRRILCARAVAVCDQYLDLAKQAAARFGVPGVFTDLGKMLAEVRPDVLHVATPPHTHRPLALQALAAGVHVYVEKPFTVDVTEAEDVLAAAVAAKRLVCVGHDQLYDPAWQECRDLYQRGELGEVVHVDAVLGYDLAGPYGRVTASDPDHWVHRLPGKFFHNTIAHALYKITDFLRDEEPRIFATWFGALPGTDCPTELRVFLQGADVTANLLSSSAIEPSQRVTRVYGTRRVVEVDLDGTKGVVLADDLEPSAAPEPWAALLPALDPTVMGWADRGWFLGPHGPALFDRSGNAGPTVWWDGRIVGGWAQRKDGEVVFRLLEDIGRDGVSAVEAVAQDLRGWLGALRVTARFRTPLEKELVA